MSLVATLGDASQNSYVTQAEATAYFADRAYADAWEDFTDKDKILITSSSMIDWYNSFKGVKTTEAQPMQWPRTGVIRKDGTEIDSDVLPPEMKVAVYELALSSLEEDRTDDDPMTGFEKVKAGPLEVKAHIDDYQAIKTPVIPDKVKKILSDLVRQSGIGVVRLMRA